MNERLPVHEETAGLIGGMFGLQEATISGERSTGTPKMLTCEAAVSSRIAATSPSRARRAMAGPEIVTARWE